MSAAEAARELGESQANVSYHLRRLQEAGLLEVAEEVRIRGGVAKRYRHDPESGSEVHSRSTDDDLMLANALAAELQRRTEYRIRGVPGTTTDAELWVDQCIWDEAQRLQENIPEDRLSRVYSYDMLGSFIALPLGQVAAGPLATHFGRDTTWLGSAALIAVATVAALCSRDIRKLTRREATYV